MVTSCMDFKIVDPDDNILFDLDDPTGAANPYGLETSAGDINIGVLPIETPSLQHGSSIPGAMYGEDELQPRQVSWTMAHKGTTNDDPDELRKALNRLAKLLREGSRKGNRILYVPRAGMSDRYIRWLGTDEIPPLLRGQTAGLDSMYEAHDGDFAGFTPYRVIAQPLLQWDKLLASENLIANASLLMDPDPDANGTPDGWTWDATTNITNQDIYPDVEGPLDNWLGAYGFDIATGAARVIRRSTAVASVAPGDDIAVAFYARASVAGVVQMQGLLDWRTSVPGTISTVTGTLTPIGTDWTLVSVLAGPAPATTDRVRVGLQLDNVDATSARVYLTAVIVAKSDSVPEFRMGPQTVTMDPASENGRVALLYNPCEASARVETKIKAPSGTVAGAGHGVLLGLQSQKPVVYANSRKMIRAEAITADTDTALASNANASGSSNNVMRTTFVTTSLQERIDTVWATDIDVLTGRSYQIIARVLSSATVGGAMRLDWGAQIPDLSNDSVSYSFTGAEAQDIDLGTVTIGEDWTSVALSLLASRTSGSGNIDWDLVAFVPVDESAVRVEQPNDLDNSAYYLFKPPGMGIAPSASLVIQGSLLYTQAFDVLDGDIPLWAPPGLSAVYVQVNDDVTGSRNVSVLTRSVEVSFDVTPHDYLG